MHTTLALGRPVEYVSFLPPYDSERAHMYYYYKSFSWNYQKEYRVLITNGQYREYSESELTEIVLGLKFDMKYFPKLVEWVREGRHSNLSLKKSKGHFIA
jgi:nitroimidazol reductase NimA-like FMN-containing flavoprotein (pyridoxamine 5'-phosphate oxidase superfamily)